MTAPESSASGSASPVVSSRVLFSSGAEGGDIAQAALVLSARLDPSLDLTASLETVDQLTSRIATEMPAGMQGPEIVQHLNERLFSEFHTTQAGYLLHPHHGLLGTVLNTKEGNCLGLSTLYLAVGRRLGLPLYMVRMPRHVFVRYDDGERTINIEATFRGIERSDASYRPDLPPKEAAASLGNLNRKQELAVLLTNAGSALAVEGRLDEAARMWSRALALDPDNAESHVNLGKLDLKAGRLTEAVANFTRAIQIEPATERGWCGRGTAHAMRNEFSGALSDFDQAIALDPQDSLPFHNRGCILLEEHQYLKAAEDFTRAIELNPAYVSAYWNRGDAWMGAGETEKAMRDYRTAVELARPQEPSPRAAASRQ